MIELRNLQFAYGESGFRLKIPELCIPQGRRVCWIGPSGSGKTTLLHLVAGIFSPETGVVKTCDVELTALRDADRRDFRIANVGLVFQDFALLDYLCVLDNILLPYRINRGLHLDSSVRERAQRLATEVGLGDMLSRRPTQLSQGERQRVAVCRAVITNPKILLADEPTANLDPGNSMRVLDALDSYSTHHKTTLVVVSHDREILTRFDDTIDVSEFCVKSQLMTSGSKDDG